MSFQWLTMRIGEERDRRAREAQILGMLPGALDELQGVLATCVHEYTAAFGERDAHIEKTSEGLRVSAGARSVEVLSDTELPGFQVRLEGPPLAIQVGVLPGDRLFYFDVAGDKYLNMEELTRRILDRVLFPKLKD